ncbi:hypothetical protein A2801_00495 [Candidatus Woesebacteria bacterium RIFCSPHIGHO2_01_FULL_41_10]|uniref:Uncharacterized protein n=1 Tax=Candidatus Woesebacteria bacterium RIFCSPHIGHO2_01_FULL_41_10 TaxID=1802500 RepID=A0A1F7YRP7_9BACT|nr:MAG: hypothetical protein A2801_00495 [Candidatus Woesebacteria bacterium RIFCSPHIGHO2_01_FULL_41_10]
MTKYKEYFQMMLEQNETLFNEFRELHARYDADPSATQTEFNQKGEKIMQIIRDYEDKLCGRSEGSGYSAYSGNLAAKFQDEIRKDFPLIDRVGVTITKQLKVTKISPLFELKKIHL